MPAPRPLLHALRARPFTAQTLRVGAALDSLGVTRALFVAQSRGASIALRLAVARPGLVRGLLAIDGGPSESAATPGMKKAFKLGGFAVKLALDESKLRHDVRREIVRNSGDTTWVTDAVIREYTAGQAADMLPDGRRAVKRPHEGSMVSGGTAWIQATPLLTVPSGTGPPCWWWTTI